MTKRTIIALAVAGALAVGGLGIAVRGDERPGHPPTIEHMGVVQ